MIRKRFFIASRQNKRLSLKYIFSLSLCVHITQRNELTEIMKWFFTLRFNFLCFIRKSVFSKTVVTILLKLKNKKIPSQYNNENYSSKGISDLKLYGKHMFGINRYIFNSAWLSNVFYVEAYFSVLCITSFLTSHDISVFISFLFCFKSILYLV